MTRTYIYYAYMSTGNHCSVFQYSVKQQSYSQFPSNALITRKGFNQKDLLLVVCIFVSRYVPLLELVDLVAVNIPARDSVDSIIKTVKENAQKKWELVDQSHNTPGISGGGRLTEIKKRFWVARWRQEDQIGPQDVAEAPQLYSHHNYKYTIGVYSNTRRLHPHKVWPRSSINRSKSVIRRCRAFPFAVSWRPFSRSLAIPSLASDNSSSMSSGVMPRTSAYGRKRVSNSD